MGVVYLNSFHSGSKLFPNIIELFLVCDCGEGGWFVLQLAIEGHRNLLQIRHKNISLVVVTN